MVHTKLSLLVCAIGTPVGGLLGPSYTHAALSPIKRLVVFQITSQLLIILLRHQIIHTNTQRH